MPKELEQHPPALILKGRIQVKSVGLKPAPLSDLYYFLMTARWSVFIPIVVITYACLNGLFAWIFLASGATIQNAEPGSFRDAFFFSIQTMSTIGYGVLTPGDGLADSLVAIESMFGLLGMAMVTGLIFAKFARPQPRIEFSRSAVITMRDGVKSLIFRTANERANTIIDGHMKAVLTFMEETDEGEPVRRFIPLELERPETPMFVLTWQGTHRIDERSPLFHMSAEDMAECDADILVTVTGIDKDLAHTMQAAHTYKLREIHHGCRLADMFAQDPDGTRLIDFRRFHDFKVD